MFNKIRRLYYRICQAWRLRMFALSGKSMQGQTSLICFSHPRCATQSMGKILEAICVHEKLNYYWGYTPLSEAVIRDMLAKYHLIFLHRTRPEDFPDQFKGIHFRGFHMIRDPRNVLVSMYFSHGYSHKLDRYTRHIEQDRRFLQSHNQEEGLLYLLDHSRAFSEMMESLRRWDYNDSRIKTIHFEDYVLHVKDYWQDILSFLGLSFQEVKLDRILADYSFKNLKKVSQKRKGFSHYRSARSDDHVKYFSPKLKDRFKERYGKLLVQLGYEKDLEW